MYSNADDDLDVISGLSIRFLARTAEPKKATISSGLLHAFPKAEGRRHAAGEAFIGAGLCRARRVPGA